MEIDKILTEYIGEIGPYQIGVLFIVCSAAVNTAFNSIDFNFVSAVPDFWCNDVNISHLLGNFTRREIQKLVSPLKAGGSDGYDACFVYQRNYSEITGDDAREVIQHGFNQTNSGDVRQCTAWLYSREKFQSTIISQVCHIYLFNSEANIFGKQFVSTKVKATIKTTLIVNSIGIFYFLSISSGLKH